MLYKYEILIAYEIRFVLLSASIEQLLFIVSLLGLLTKKIDYTIIIMQTICN